jgi:peptidoglycan/LPS O-acetylase OafA/YrhL
MAAFSVLFSHFLPHTPLNYLWLQSLGALGIYLLFTMSGYLITTILLRCRKNVALGLISSGMAAQRFYIRRILRVFPLFYGTLAVAWLAGIPDVPEHLTWHALFATNIFAFLNQGFMPGAYTGHFWTIAVEIQFYLLWPWLLIYLPRAKIFWVVALLTIAGPMLRIGAILAGQDFFVVMLPSCLDGIGMGSLLALTAEPWIGAPVKREPLMRYALVVGLPLWMMTTLMRGLEVVPHWNDSLLAVPWHLSMALLGGWIIGKAAGGFQGATGKILSFAPLVYCGQIGYGLYIMHMFFIPGLPAIFRYVGLERYLSLAENPFVLVAVTILTASLSWKIMEQPVNNLKRFFPYKT